MFEIITADGLKYEVSLEPVAEDLKTPEVKAWLLACEKKIADEFFARQTINFLSSPK